MNHAVASSARQRLLGAVWFGVWGFLAAGLVYLPAVLDRPLPLLLYVLLPGLSALPAGALVGPGILDPERAGPWKAAGLGLLAAVLAHVFFAPLFALAMELSATENSSFTGFWIATSVLGIPMLGVITLPAGTLAGWLLHLVGRAIR